MKNTTGLTIPKEVIEQAKLGDEITIESFPAVIVLKNTNLTTLEVVEVIRALESITDKLYVTLLEEFPQDDDCEECGFCEGILEDCIDVPDWAKEACGIDPKAKLCICAEEDSGRILLEPTQYEHDLSDVDDEMLEILVDMGVCLGDLNESIMCGEVIYHD